jgi:hypothetical protein
MERGYTILAIGTIKILAMAGENEKIVETCNGLLDELEAEAAQQGVHLTGRYVARDADIFSNLSGVGVRIVVQLATQVTHDR